MELPSQPWRFLILLKKRWICDVLLKDPIFFPVAVEYVTLFLPDQFMFLNYRLSLKSLISFLSILYFFSLKQLTFAVQGREIIEVKSNSHYYFFQAEIYVIQKLHANMCERT